MRSMARSIPKWLWPSCVSVTGAKVWRCRISVDTQLTVGLIQQFETGLNGTIYTLYNQQAELIRKDINGNTFFHRMTRQRTSLTHRQGQTHRLLLGLSGQKGTQRVRAEVSLLARLVQQRYK